MADKSQANPHALMVSFLFQGHITPFVHLAINLASKGCTVTFVQTEFLHHQISKAAAATSSSAHDEGIADIFMGARESGLDIRYATISDGFPLEFDRSLNFDEFWESILRDFPARVDEFVGKIVAECDDGVGVPSFLVADSSYLWADAVAHKYNMINVSFWTEAALVLSIGYHLDLLKAYGHFPSKGIVEDGISYIPGIQSISTRDFMSYLEGDNDPFIPTSLYQNIIKAYEEVKKADFILCNTVQELEFDTLLALNQKQPTYAIGPMNFHPNSSKSIVANSLWPEVDCIKWLDSKLPGSVLYISFGSTVETNKQVILEIAHGLLLSQVNFIWILRRDLVSFDGSDVLPPGFEDSIGDRGLVIPWCNQSLVLSTPAIGGFLTHCGWNSILESIWYGVPMICYPLSVDQPTNRKLVVDDWKIGINLCDKEPLSWGEVAEKIDSLMSGTTPDSLRQEMKKVKKMVHKAVAINGSSEKNLDQFLTDLKAKIHLRTYIN
ncbi:hypothetical protein Pfo_016535 [Paulownia fortunei]|nr:hypothetical protein Pfo_016535 [Paulownia fortunei]